MSPPLTLVLCSNRPQALPGAAERLRLLLGPSDGLLVVVDTADFPPSALPAACRTDCRVRFVRNGANMGLSYSRNAAMKQAATRHVVFLDDDIDPSAEALSRVRASLAGGAHVVGTRITARFPRGSLPWYITAGQLHYLGSHHPGRPASVWGGCFALDLDYVRAHGLSFDVSLGRTGRSLNSAEDTTFVHELVARGANRVVLHDVEVRHEIAAHRLRLGFLLRRAYWQGRSEARRGWVRRGLVKEWVRNRGGDARFPHRAALALMYTAAVLCGELHELVFAAGRGRRRGEFTVPRT